MGRRRLILLGLAAFDIGVLSVATYWVATRGTAPPGVGASTAHASGLISGGNEALASQPSHALTPVMAVPTRATSASDRRLRGGPKFCLSTAVDHEGNLWVGTEDQGVWCSQGGDNWLSYGLADGLGDNSGTAMACDAIGRVWVGHADHGLSIYDGQTWRTYDRLAGPGGSHVFCLACCPTDGDVWMGTEAGLTRYSLKHDTWTTIDRSTGLLAGQVTCMAFDSAGNLYAGMSSNGLAIALAADGYSKWAHVSGPEDLPIVASGPGLPSQQVNAVLVTHPDETVYVGTSHGLARSIDHGTTWTYVRGKNWPLVSKGRYDGLPAGFTGTPAGLLMEDWVSALAQDPAGVLWVGCREAGLQSFPDLHAEADYSGKGGVSAMVVKSDGTVVAVTLGAGVIECGTTYTAATPPAKTTLAAASTDVFPTPSPVPTAAELDALCRQVQSLEPGKDGVDFLGDDWGTQGDWCGRYGNRVRWLLGCINFTTDAVGYGVENSTGPYRNSHPSGGTTPGHQSVNGLLDPTDGTRYFTETNDSSYYYKRHPRWQQGPDVYLVVTLPRGVHRVSIYEHNWDGHESTRMFRDHPIEVTRLDDATPDAAAVNAGDQSQRGMSWPQSIDRADLVAAELAPIAARSRAVHFYRPVYIQFLVRGAGRYAFRVDHNESDNTKANAIFIDRLDVPPTVIDKYPNPPKAKDYTADPGLKGSAARLWAALDAAVGRRGYADIQTRARNAAYLAGASAGIDAGTLARWRWQMPLWLGSDRQQFDDWVNQLPKPVPDK